MREGLKADLGKGIPRSLLRFLRAQTLRCAQGQGDVAKRIEMGEEAKILENEAQARSGIGEGKRAPIERFQAHQAPKKEDFPAPEGPSRQRCSPRARVMDRLLKSSSTPKALRAPRKGEHHGAHAGRPRRRSRRRTMATKGRRISRYSPAAAIRGVGLASRA